MKSERKVIVFTKASASFGGAESVEYTERFAWIKLPGVSNKIRISRSRLKQPESLTAFYLADMADHSNHKK